MFRFLNIKWKVKFGRLSLQVVFERICELLKCPEVIQTAILRQRKNMLAKKPLIDFSDKICLTLRYTTIRFVEKKRYSFLTKTSLFYNDVCISSFFIDWNIFYCLRSGKVFVSFASSMHQLILIEEVYEYIWLFPMNMKVNSQFWPRFMKNKMKLSSISIFNVKPFFWCLKIL